MEPQLWNKIRDVLIREWDPIGVGDESADEYDSYIPGVAQLLAGGCDKIELERHLRQIEKSSMGLSYVDARMPVRRRRNAVNSLQALSGEGHSE